MCRHESFLSLPSSDVGPRAQNPKHTFDLTLQTTGLLSKLLDTLSSPITAWESFNSLNGDIGYFSDFDSSQESSSFRSRQSLRAINDTVQTWKDLQATLLRLRSHCRDIADTVSLIHFNLFTLIALKSTINVHVAKASITVEP